jgi:hypothetical protein
MFTLILQRWMIWLRHSRRRAGREALIGLCVAGALTLLWPRPGGAVPALAGTGQMLGPARIIIGGDVMLARGVDRLMRAEGAGYLFRGLRRDLIRPEDFFTFNLESPLGEDESEEASRNELKFLADPGRSLAALIASRVDLVNLGNNMPWIMGGGSWPTP